MPMRRSILTQALAGMASITLASGTTTASSAAPSSTSALPPVEVDVIFPVHNATYNITESLPIVLAVQNLASAAALGPFTFGWDIMPYGNIGGVQEPGGAVNDYWTASFTTSNASTEPYILVNQTNVQNWQFGPFFPNGSVYALQWSINWPASANACNSNPLGTLGWIFFNIDLGSPEPDLANITGQCPQLGAAYEIDNTFKNSSCLGVVSASSSNNSCAVKVDKSTVGDISSQLQSLISASAAATATTAIPTPTPTKHNIAVGSNVPLLYVVFAVLLGSAQTLIPL